MFRKKHCLRNQIRRGGGHICPSVLSPVTRRKYPRGTHMRNTALIVGLIGVLLFTAVYGAITVVYSRLARGGLHQRYSDDLPEATSHYVHDVYIDLLGGVRVTGNGQTTGRLTWGFLKLPVSDRQNVGKLLLFLASVGGVALGAYVWRGTLRNAFGPPS